MTADYFPQRPDVRPSVYAYRDMNPDHVGLLKVGYTRRHVERRVAQQFPVIQPGEGKPYEIVFAESAMRPDGTSFMDHDVHRRLERKDVYKRQTYHDEIAEAIEQQRAEVLAALPQAPLAE